MPRSPIFSQLFARYPISPIQEHMKVAGATAAELPAFMTAVFAGDWDKAKAIQERIAALETEADVIKRNVRSNLPRSIFMPVSRSDLLELLKAQDRIPNRCQDLAGLCIGRRMVFPELMQPLMFKFIESCTTTVAEAGKALNELDELLETGFSGREIESIENLIADLNQAEHDTDELQREVQNALFEVEKEMDALDVMFMYRLIEWIGDIADYAQSVGNRMLYIIAK
jgi:predicted phosphate transport protein (TIGR00153 family)